MDIQRVACQIAKLRFFISLVVEQQKTADPIENYGIRPLPNLETRFVAANTLLPLVERSGNAQVRVASNRILELQRKLSVNRERYFHARHRQEKLAARHRDSALRGFLAHELRAVGLPGNDANLIAQWDPYDQNAEPATWFDPEYMFGIKRGFDITIGNPPYVRADFPDPGHRATRAAVKRCRAYETPVGKWDLFIAFMERSFKMLAPEGVSSLIVKDTLGHAEYAKKAREWFLSNSLIERIDSYGTIKLFDAAVHNVFLPPSEQPRIHEESPTLPVP